MPVRKPTNSPKQMQAGENPFVELAKDWWEWRRSQPEPNPLDVGLGFVGGITGRGGLIGQNRAGRQRLTDLFERLGKKKPEQLKRTSPQGNKKLRETVANEEKDLFRPEGEGFVGSFRTLGPRDLPHFMIEFNKGAKGLPTESWYSFYGFPSGLRSYHKALLADAKVKVGEKVSLPLPVNALTKRNSKGELLGTKDVTKTAGDAKSADVLDLQVLRDLKARELEKGKTK